MLKRIILLTGLAGMLVLTGCIITATASVPRTTVRPAPDDDDTNVRVVGPPAVVVVDDPELVVIPGTYVYWLDGQEGVYFYGGGWWRAWDGYWYRADVYNGQWVRVELGHVPHPVTHLPYGWHENRYDAPRVHWYDARNHWRGWENDKYWDKRKWKKTPPKH